MKKNTVKLNEANLKKIVAESVKNVLSELDWKTYANAANKAREKWSSAANGTKDKRKYSDQWDNFDKASEDAFNKKYATSKYKYSTDGTDNYKHSWDRVVQGPKHMKVSSLGDGSWNESYFDYDPEKGETDGTWFEKGNSHKAHQHDSRFPNNPYYDMDADEMLDAVGNQVNNSYKDADHLDAAKKGNKELKDYFNGNYEYQKGEGWKLKESVEKAVKNVLKEYLNKNK